MQEHNGEPSVGEDMAMGVGAERLVHVDLTATPVRWPAIFMVMLVGVTLGTGIGGGIVVDGEILHGASDAAAEIGHMTIDFTGRRCKCGNYGCLEAYCSGPNIAARAIEGIEAGEETLLLDLVGGDLSKVTAATVYEAVVLGDRYTTEVVTATLADLQADLRRYEEEAARPCQGTCASEAVVRHAGLDALLGD